MSEGLDGLLEHHIVASLLRQRRLDRFVGKGPWSYDVRARRLDIGNRRFRLDVLGTASKPAETWLWGWANPSFTPEVTVSAQVLRQRGVEWGMHELTDDREIPFGVTAVVVECIPAWQRDEPEGAREPGEGSPGRGVQYAWLLSASICPSWQPENIARLPPAANRAMTAAERRVLRAGLDGQRVAVSADCDYDDDSPVPAQIRYRCDAGPHTFDEVIRAPRA